MKPSLKHSAPLINTERLVIRLLDPDEVKMMLSFRFENRTFLEPWEPRRRPEFFTENYWRLQLQAHRREFQLGQSVCLAILDQPQKQVLGVCNFTNIVRGTFQSCHLGYALAEKHQGHGYMQEALAAACDFMFDQMLLHRIMANYLPRNERSGRLLARLGFEKEGLARQFLLINGIWEDHVLTSRLNPRHQST